MQLFGYDLANIAANAGYILTISALVSLLVKNFIVKPFEKKREKEQKELEKRQNEFQVKIFEKFAEELKPFQDTVDTLNDVLTNFRQESSSDRDNLNKVASKHDEDIKCLDDRVDKHEVRISVLEGKKMVYKEVYKGEEK